MAVELRGLPMFVDGPHWACVSRTQGSEVSNVDIGKVERVIEVEPLVMPVPEAVPMPEPIDAPACDPEPARTPTSAP